MSKAKILKNDAVGTVHYWWSLALFARQFEIEANAPPARIAQQLRRVQQPLKGLLMPTKLTVSTQEIEPEHIYTFDLRIKRRSRGVDYTCIKASGRIIYSQGYETSIIRGDVRLGWVYYAAHIAITLGIMLMVAVSIGSGNPEAVAPLLIFTGVFLSFAFWHIYRDYHDLNATLMQQFEQAYYEQLAHDHHLPAAETASPVAAIIAENQHRPLNADAGTPTGVRNKSR